MHVSTNYFVPDNSESDDDKVQENHSTKKRKLVEEQHDQQQAKKRHASSGWFTMYLHIHSYLYKIYKCIAIILYVYICIHI